MLHTYSACTSFYHHLIHQMPLWDRTWSTFDRGCRDLLTTVFDFSTLSSFHSGSKTINRTILASTRQCSIRKRQILIQWSDNTVAPISPGCPFCNHFKSFYKPDNDCPAAIRIFKTYFALWAQKRDNQSQNLSRLITSVVLFLQNFLSHKRGSVSALYTWS